MCKTQYTVRVLLEFMCISSLENITRLSLFIQRLLSIHGMLLFTSRRPAAVGSRRGALCTATGCTQALCTRLGTPVWLRVRLIPGQTNSSTSLHIDVCVWYSIFYSARTVKHEHRTIVIQV